jgi:hypothetical protein
VKTPVETLLAVADIGGEMALADGDNLRTLLPSDCPPELRAAIRDNKPGLLALLSGPVFAVVRSELLPGEFVLWTADENGRQRLIAHGAAAGSIYTRDELAEIVRKKTDPDTLRKLHAAKRTFDGRLKGSHEHQS